MFDVHQKVSRKARKGRKGLKVGTADSADGADDERDAKAERMCGVRRQAQRDAAFGEGGRSRARFLDAGQARRGGFRVTGAAARGSNRPPTTERTPPKRCRRPAGRDSATALQKNSGRLRRLRRKRQRSALSGQAAAALPRASAARPTDPCRQTGIPPPGGRPAGTPVCLLFGLGSWRQGHHGLPSAALAEEGLFLARRNPRSSPRSPGTPQLRRAPRKPDASSTYQLPPR